MFKFFFFQQAVNLVRFHKVDQTTGSVGGSSNVNVVFRACVMLYRSVPHLHRLGLALGLV